MKPRVVAGVAAVLAVTTVVFAALAVGYKGDLDERRAGDAQRDAVADVAGRLVLAVLNFDPATADAQVDAVLGLAGGAFAEEYEAAAPGIRQTYESIGAVSRGTVVEILVGDLDPEAGDATAVVVYDQEVDSPLGPRTLQGRYLRLELRIDAEGAWRVHEVQDVQGGGSGVELPAPDEPLSSPSPVPPAEEPP